MFVMWQCRRSLSLLTALMAAAPGGMGWLLVGGRAYGQQGLAAPASSEWRFEAWPVDGAGPHPVAELPDGTLAVGTAAGVRRFDGRRMLELPGPVGGGGALFLHVDRGGVLHALYADATHVGIAANDAWTYAAGLPRPEGEGVKGVEPTSICEDHAGVVWVGHRNGLVSRTTGRGLVWIPTATTATTSDDAPVHVTADHEGRVWMARKGCLAVWTGAAWESKANLTTGPITIASSPRGGLWLRIGAPLHHFDEARGLMQPFADCLPTISTLREDDDGRLWIGTSRYGLISWERDRLATVATTGRSIVGVVPDRRGGIWVGTGAGLEHGNRRIVRRLEMPTIKPLRTVATAADGSLWFLTLDGDLGSRGPGGLPHDDPLAGGPHRQFSALSIATDGALWLGTRAGELVRCPAERGSPEQLSPPAALRGQPVTALAVAGDGVWAALGSQLAWTDGERWLRPASPGTDPASEITLLVADDSGNAWGAAGGCVIRAAAPAAGDESIHVECRTPTEFPDDAFVTAICPLADRTVWIATRHTGLWRLRDDRSAHIDVRHGLPSGTLLAAQPDDCGRLWFAGDRLFFAAGLRELDAVADGRYDWVHAWVASGENDLAFFDPAVVPPGIAARDPDGRVIVVLPTGLAICEPDLLPTDAPAPEVRIVEVQGDGRPIGAPWSAGHALPHTVGVRVPADTRIVTCALTESGFGSPSSARVQHRLEGIDAGWIDTPRDRVVTYTRLPAGRHALRLRSSTASDVWQGDRAGFVIQVEPRPWERPWVRMAVVAGAALLAGAVAYARQAIRSNLEIGRVRQAAALDRERMRIARDMHDEIGTSLTQISLLTELIRSRAAAEVADELEGVTTIARETVASLDEIVWAVNPKHDTLAHLLSYVALHASQALGRLGISCVIDLPEEPEPRAVTAEFRRAILCIVKEAVGNVIRHADAGQVVLSVQVVGGRLQVTIVDDGRGFGNSEGGARLRQAAGLENMRVRAMDLGGMCAIRSRYDAGTEVCLDVPLPASR